MLAVLDASSYTITPDIQGCNAVLVSHKALDSPLTGGGPGPSLKEQRMDAVAAEVLEMPFLDRVEWS